MSTVYPLKARREIEKEVLTEYLPDLVAVLQDNVLPILNGCLSKKLVSRSIHSKILHGSDSPEEKATILVTAIINSTTSCKDCFQKFMSVLEDYEELVKSMTVAVEEASERVYKEQCQDDRTSVQSVETIALTECTLQLSGACEYLLVKIASECWTKQIISKDVYQEAKRKSHNSKVRTRLFLQSITSAIEKDISKFSSFVMVLKKHPSCCDVACKLQQSVVVLKANSFGGSHKDHQPDGQNIPAATRVPKPLIKGGPVVSSGIAGSLQADPKISSLRECTGSSTNKNNELQRVKELEIQSKQNQKAREEKEHMKRLQEELLATDREKDSLQEDIETLKFAAYLSKRISPEVFLKLQKAKERELDLKDRQIRELIKERDELSSKLNETHDSPNAQKIIKKTRRDLQNLKEANKNQHKKRKDMYKTDRWVYLFLLFVTMLVLILLIMYTLYT